MTWFKCIGGNGGTPAPTRTLVYTLQAGSQWETFPNPNSSMDLEVESCFEGEFTTDVPEVTRRTYTVDLSLLPSIDYGGDPYSNIGVTRNGTPINMRTGNSGATIYISTNGYPTQGETVKVYKLD